MKKLAMYMWPYSKPPIILHLTIHQSSFVNYTNHLENVKNTEVITDACDRAVNLKARQAQVMRLSAGVFAILMNSHVSPALLLLCRRLQRPRRRWSKHNQSRRDISYCWKRRPRKSQTVLYTTDSNRHKTSNKLTNLNEFYVNNYFIK